MICIVCGGDHEPHPSNCTDPGMDEQIEKMGARKWNRITGQVARELNRRAAGLSTPLRCDEND